ncbi:hypothetical protein T8K17_02250 [Thalassobaculum sp. OXR-137]|uniref:hypothetical protein n=1 Tax=Thalassobaculum sp. OXR-137 TaxID=3100173 RepID=UPI002AC9EBC4|nr:hypothetical protein [Thalassobaculum sp. OXR-137]WPZ34974.1 hypothetical protein T8K17_02250 [Thalassobaculum sp. OXR-137]
MVSPVDGPGPLPASYLPVPTGGRAVVPYVRAETDRVQAGESGQRRPDRTGGDAVAVPVTGSEPRPESRGNPFLERGEAFRRPLLASRPAATFLAQSFAQDGDAASRTGSAEAARRYRSVQETVDRDTARRTGPPGVDVVT